MAWELDTDQYHLEIDTGTDLIPLDDVRMSRLGTALRAWKSALDLQSVTFTRTAPGVYDYAFTPVGGGRTWSQEITVFPITTEHTFDQIQGVWQESEFIPNRAVRDLFVELARAYDLVKVEITWF